MLNECRNITLAKKQMEAWAIMLIISLGNVSSQNQQMDCAGYDITIWTLIGNLCITVAFTIM